tara:strand:+ start:3344 stop:3685 length:342 start_codon:yes stop_codon:yes gene_type:complete
MKTVVIYDSNCGFCKKISELLKKKDKMNLIQWIDRDSDSSKHLIEKYKISYNIDSIIYIKNERFYTKSEAVLLILKNLNIKISILLKFIPKKISDKLYDLIANNRYFFGKCIK